MDYSDLDVFTEEEKAKAEGDSTSPLASRGFVHQPVSKRENIRGGVIADGGIRRDATLGIAALRHLHAGSNAEKTRVLRRYILGLSLVAFTVPLDTYLRQGCTLVLDPDAKKPRDLVEVYADGKRLPCEITHDAALDYATEAASSFGVGESRTPKFEKERAKRNVSAGEKKGKKKNERDGQGGRQVGGWIMQSYLCITVRFIQPFSHGRRDGDDLEWPPSPLRLFQALVASSAGLWNERTAVKSAAPALSWLESQPAPEIVAPDATPCDRAYRLYVPDNVADKVAAAWSKGRHADIADYRVEKDVRSARISGEAVNFLYSLPDGRCAHFEKLLAAVRSITHIGWGVDLAVGDARIVPPEQADSLEGSRCAECRWAAQLRVPIEGTLVDLTRKHAAFLSRLSNGPFSPVPPLSKFQVRNYRRNDERVQRPYRVFELRSIDGSRFRYPHRRLVHIAAMTGHLAIDAMKTSPPAGVADDWVEAYVAGHAAVGGAMHRQLSYLPLPSIGVVHTDPGVRRVMVAAPLGDHELLGHVAPPTGRADARARAW